MDLCLRSVVLQAAGVATNERKANMMIVAGATPHTKQFSFPANTDLRNRWIKFVNREGWNPVGN